MTLSSSGVLMRHVGRASERVRGTTAYGFVWGPVEVTRVCKLPKERRVVQVKTKHRSLEIYVSVTGRSVRVFSEGKEWKP